jgi:hypothetical protein
MARPLVGASRPGVTCGRLRASAGSIARGWMPRATPPAAPPPATLLPCPAAPSLPVLAGLAGGLAVGPEDEQRGDRQDRDADEHGAE